MRLLAAGAAAAAAALVCTAAGSAAVITRTAATASYRLTLVVGPTQPMYTTAQLRKSHPTTGELMLSGGSGSGGAMGAMGGGMSSMAGGLRHLEVHVYARASGKALAGLMPAITLTDTAAKTAKPVKLAVVVMEGIGAGPGDIHYGNNVTLTPMHTYRVTVELHDQLATFTFTAS